MALTDTSAHGTYLDTKNAKGITYKALEDANKHFETVTKKMKVCMRWVPE